MTRWGGGASAIDYFSMIDTLIRETVDALSADEKVSLLEYLERATATTDFPLSDDALALLDRRAAEMAADPSIGIPEDEFCKQVRARQL